MDRQTFGACVLRAAAAMPGYRDELCRLDMGIGDGDHGVTVERGFSAVSELFSGDPGDGGQPFYQRLSDTLAASMGGAIGPIYGLFFAGIGAGLKDADRVDAKALAAAMLLATQKVMRVAKVNPGEKTIVDAMLPACEAMTSAEGLPLAEALRRACEAAEQGARRTVDMRAAKGRARFLKERSIGYRDAGASSFTLYLEALRDQVAAAGEE